MSEAQLLFQENKKYLLTSGKVMAIVMDLWLVPESRRYLYPDGLKFGWIAFNEDNPKERILLDYNPKKGFRYHIDEQPIVKLQWVSLTEAQQLFRQMVYEKFGEISQEITK